MMADSRARVNLVCCQRSQNLDEGHRGSAHELDRDIEEEIESEIEVEITQEQQLQLHEVQLHCSVEKKWLWNVYLELVREEI